MQRSENEAAIAFEVIGWAKMKDSRVMFEKADKLSKTWNVEEKCIGNHCQWNVVKQLRETANMVLQVVLHHDITSDDTHDEVIRGLKHKRTFF